MKSGGNAMAPELSLRLTEEHHMAAKAIDPGEHLAEELKELGISAAEPAREPDIPTNRAAPGPFLRRQPGDTD